jgi:hypothetical protein
MLEKPPSAAETRAGLRAMDLRARRFASRRPRSDATGRRQLEIADEMEARAEALERPPGA